MSQDCGHEVNLYASLANLNELLPEIDLNLLTWQCLESNRSQGQRPLFSAKGSDGSLERSQINVKSATCELLLNNDGVAFGNGTEEITNLTKCGCVEVTRRGAFLKANLRSSEITSDRVTGDTELPGGPLPAEASAAQLVDPIHDIRLQHPTVLLLLQQTDGCHLRVIHLRFKQVDQI
jgi:hypothetical protein